MKKTLIVIALLSIIGCSASRESLTITKVKTGFQVKEYNGVYWEAVGPVQPTREDARTVKVLQKYNQGINAH